MLPREGKRDVLTIGCQIGRESARQARYMIASSRPAQHGYSPIVVMTRHGAFAPESICACIIVCEMSHEEICEHHLRDHVSEANPELQSRIAHNLPEGKVADYPRRERRRGDESQTPLSRTTWGIG